MAELGLGANTVQEAVYPTALTDSGGRPLTGASDYRLVFKPGQAPPNRAFWSLTMYDSSGFLVPNPLHRYAIGSTHPPLRRQPDGSIVILISHARPRGSHINWLPAPSAGFRLNMRIYRPRRDGPGWALAATPGAAAHPVISPGTTPCADRRSRGSGARRPRPRGGGSCGHHRAGAGQALDGVVGHLSVVDGGRRELRARRAQQGKAAAHAEPDDADLTGAVGAGAQPGARGLDVLVGRPRPDRPPAGWPRRI